MTGAEQTPQERLAEELWEDGVYMSRDAHDIAAFVLERSDVIREMRQQDRLEAREEGWRRGLLDSTAVAPAPSPHPYDQEASDEQ